MTRFVPSLSFLAVFLVAAAMPAASSSLEFSGRAVELTGGPPPSGARVELYRSLDRYYQGRLELKGRRLPETTAIAEAGEDGGFVVRAPGPGMWNVLVRAPGYVPMRLRLEPIFEDATLPELRLRPDAGVTVRVVGAEGRPLGGAIVWTERRQLGRVWGRTWQEGWWPAPGIGLTDDAGTITLPRAEGEELVVFAWAPGFLQASAARTAGHPVSIHLEPADERRLQVTQGGEPAVGVLIRVGEERWPVGVTDERGAVRLPVLPTRSTWLEADSDKGWRFSDRLTWDGRQSEFMELRLPQPIEIEGRVVDAASGEPVAGAVVWRRKEPPNRVVADARGSFSAPMVPGERLELIAGAPGYLSSKPALWHGAEPSGALPVLALTHAAAVAGVVVDGDGEPVGRALVELQEERPWSTWSDPAPSRRAVTTPASGRFRLAGLDPDRRYELRASAAGFAPEVRSVEPGEGPLELVLRPGARVVGLVVDEARRGLPGARVLCFRIDADGRPIAELETATDADGTFALRDLPSGRYDLEVAKVGKAPRDLPAVEVPGEPRQVDLGTVVLEDEAVIEGRVVDAHGEPIGGARVRIGGERPGSSAFRVTRADGARGVPTSPDGRFRLGQLNHGERVDLTVQHPEYVAASLPQVEAPTQEPLEVVLGPGARVFGTVVDSADAPVAGATVRLVTTVEKADGRAAFLRLRLQDRQTDETGEDGTFSVSHVAPGKLGISVSRRGFVRFDEVGPEVMEGQELGPLRLVLARGVRLEGRVVGAAGRPVPGADVAVRRPDRGSRLAGATTDASGDFAIDDLGTGQVEVTARHTELGSASRVIELGEAGRYVELTLELAASLGGRVTTPEGEPVSEATVVLTPVAGGVPSFTNTGTEGRFRFTDLAPGAYSLKASADGYAETPYPWTVNAAEAPVDGIEIRLVRGTELSGWVLGAEDFSLLSVAATPSNGGQSVHGVVDYRGHYRLQGLSPGTWTVTASDERDGRTATAKVELLPGEERVSADLELERGLRLAGQVLVAGRPLPSARVAIGSASGEQRLTETSADGRFEMRGLPPGEYRIRVTGAALAAAAERRVQIDADQDVVLEIDVHRVDGWVVTADSSPVDGVDVVLRQSWGAVGGGSPTVEVTTDADGAFSFARVPDGAYQLAAKAPQGAAAMDLEVRSADVTGIELRLGRAAAAVFLARLPDGSVPRMLSVVLQREGSSQSLTETLTPGTGGTFEIALPEGRWTAMVIALEQAVARFSITVPGAPIQVALQPITRLRVTIPELADSEVSVSLALRDAAGRPFSLPGLDMASMPVADGTLELPLLPPGRWSIEVTDALGHRWTGSAVTRPGEVKEVLVE